MYEKLDDFPSRTFDKLRFGDTDRQGHVNNAVFATFCETGRVHLIAAAFELLDRPRFTMVIVRFAVDFRKELFWPGTVEIGTAIKSVGRSSVTFAQALFQNGHCVAAAESITAHVDGQTNRAAPIEEPERAQLVALIRPPPGAGMA